MQVNLLHPLASLEWRKCHKLPEFHELPVDVRDAQAVVLESKVYIGGGNVLSGTLSSRLLIYNFIQNSWDILRTPTKWFGLTTYHSQLVLVGGKDPTRMGSATNRLWVLDGQSHWTQPLPPMLTKCYGASAISVGNHLIVAGGLSDEGPLDKVQVYDSHEWRRAQSLPKACYFIKCALDKDEKWYLAGGVGQGRDVYHTSLQSLMATTNLEGIKQISVWQKLPNVPLLKSTPVVFGKQLLVAGGGDPCSSVILAYASDTNSWVHVGNLPVACYSTCTIVLPTGELLMVGGVTDETWSSCHVFKAKLQGIY